MEEIGDGSWKEEVGGKLTGVKRKGGGKLKRGGKLTGAG